MPQSNSDPPVRGFQLKMRHSIRNRGRTFPISLEPLKEGPRVDSKERMLLEAAERGDKHTIIRCLQPPNPVNINCTDIMGRSAIQIAVDNENVEIVEVLLKQDGVKIGDALLYAIREGVYRIVEMLIDHPSIGREMLGSDWAEHKRAESEESSDYSPDVSPVILAAYCNQFEILQLLLSRGARIVKPHSLSCCCQRCKRETSEDSLRHSLLRIHTYRALSSPAWISLTSPDPVLTAFKLSRELERLAMCENEFKDLYAELSEQCKKFSCNLLDQCRSSEEVIAVLDKSSDPAATQGYLEEDGEEGGSEEDDDDDDDDDVRRRRKEEEELEDRDKKKLTLDRFKLALKYEQKQFVAHPHCQQLLASIWYEGIPGWRRRSFPTKVIVIISLICLLPVMAVIYLLLPRSRIGCLVRTPFMKFMYHSASFGVFLFLLILASTNVGAGDGNLKARQQQRGPPPSTLEWLIGAYVLGFVWAECKQLWEEGLKAYVRQWWNWLDFIMLSLYLCTFTLRLVAYVHSHYPAKYGPNILPRTRWPEADPTLVSEGVFAIANVFSFARIIYLFQANPQLGPLQISLGCMLIDIGKFFFIFFLVITSFACGLNQLYYFYSASGALVTPAAATSVAPHDGASNRAPVDNWSATTAGEQQTTAQQQQEQLQDNDFENAFDPLDTSFITLFWTLFGLIALAVLQVKLRYIEGFGKVLFGLYNVAARILFLNMLIAMMSKSFNVTVDHADREWKFARSKLWMGYYDDGSTLPPPFNLIVSPKSLFYILCRLKVFLKNCVARRQSKASKRRRKAAARLAKQKPRKDCEDNPEKTIERRKYEDVMRRLVSRFIHQWKKQLRQDGVSEDDLLEIKQDISSLRYELREDRKRGEFQSALHMENLKRDILRFIGTTSHQGNNSNSNAAGPVGVGGAVGTRSATLSRDSSVDDKIDDMGGSSHRSSSGVVPHHLLPDDLCQLRRDIVRSLRSELADIAREMSSHAASNERGGAGGYRTTLTSSAVAVPLSSGQTPPSLSIPANSELYHTHLYTQL